MSSHVMSLHVVAGAGPIGSAVASLLTAEGQQVRILTRGGGGIRHPNVECVAVDAGDTARLTELTRGAAALYNCVNPQYNRWPTLWPPIAASFLAAAEATGAVLASMGNLYGYGPVEEPMTERTPLRASNPMGLVRAEMWRAAAAAHAAGRVRVTEARASDFIGPAAHSLVCEYLFPALGRKKTLYLPVDLDAPHSFTYTLDAARTLVAIARDERAWGQAWHVPSDRPVSFRELSHLAAEIAGLSEPRLKRMAGWPLAVAGLFSSDIRGFRNVAYQFDRPFRLDSSRAEEILGLAPTPLPETLAATLRADHEDP